MRLQLSTNIVARACVVLLATSPAFATPKGEIKATFSKFVAAQNAHNITAVRELLSDSPNFLWITRGNVVRGRDAALERYARLFEGTWRLDPDWSTLEIMMLDVSTAQIFVRMVITNGTLGQPTPAGSTVMNQILVKTSGGWRVLSVLPGNLPPN
jgi:Domain of unknown function (DUF4440)